MTEILHKALSFAMIVAVMEVIFSSLEYRRVVKSIKRDANSSK